MSPGKKRLKKPRRLLVCVKIVECKFVRQKSTLQDINFAYRIFIWNLLSNDLLGKLHLSHT